MKKLISLLLAVCLVLSAVPTLAFADGYSNDVQQQLIDLACATFPEYANSIRNPVSPNALSRSNSNPTLVRSEARKASDRVCVIYSQYDDGSVFLTSVEGDNLSVEVVPQDWVDDLIKELDKPPVTTITSHDTSPSGGSTKHTLTIKGTHPGVTGYFQITGFTYTIVGDGYDRIDSTGTTSLSGDWTDCSVYGSPNYNETSSSAAYTTFRARFRFGSGNYYSRETELHIRIKDDTMTYSHVNFN